MKNCFIIKVDEYRIAIADLCRYVKGYIITRINVPAEFRGLGHGSALLKQITDEADRTQTTLYLEILPSGPLSYSDLEAWYKRHGFKSSMVLIRKPRRDANGSSN